MLKKSCNFLVPGASVRIALYSGVAQAAGISSIEEVAFNAILSGFRRFYGGLWVGGTLSLDGSALKLTQNRLNLLAHKDDYSLTIPVSEINQAEFKMGFFTGIVIIHTANGTIKLRCYGARRVRDEIARLASCPY